MAREDVLTAALASVVLITALHEEHAERLSAALETYEEAGRIRRAARASEQRLSLSLSIEDFQSRLVKLTTSVASAKTAQEQLSKARRNAVATEINAGLLATLQQQHRGLRELEIRQGAIATRLKFDLQTEHSVTLDGLAVEGQGERFLWPPANSLSRALGRLRSLRAAQMGELARERSELQEDHEALLQRVGVQSIDAALQRNVEHAWNRPGPYFRRKAPWRPRPERSRCADCRTYRNHHSSLRCRHRTAGRFPEATESTDLSRAVAERVQKVAAQA